MICLGVAGVVRIQSGNRDFVTAKSRAQIPVPGGDGALDAYVQLIVVFVARFLRIEAVRIRINRGAGQIRIVRLIRQTVILIRCRILVGVRYRRIKFKAVEADPRVQHHLFRLLLTVAGDTIQIRVPGNVGEVRIWI